MLQRLVHRRLRSIRQRPQWLRQRPTGQFANVRYLSSTNENKAAYWYLECNPNPLVILGSRNFKQCQFRLTDFRSICMFLMISQDGSSRGSWACWIPTKARQFPIRWYCITMWINIITFPFFRSKQSLFLQFDLVRNKMERTQVNNSNFITVHSMKYWIPVISPSCKLTYEQTRLQLVSSPT